MQLQNCIYFGNVRNLTLLQKGGFRKTKRMPVTRPLSRYTRVQTHQVGINFPQTWAESPTAIVGLLYQVLYTLW